MNYYFLLEDEKSLIKVPGHVDETKAKYHFHYLHDALLYNRIRYNKKRPNNIATKEYFLQLVLRMNETSHIRSFKELYDYICLQKVKG